MSKVFVYSILALIVLKIGAAFFTNFSLYGDEAQYWLWSKELDFGYYLGIEAREGHQDPL